MEKTAILAYEGCWAMSVFAATDFFRIVALLEQHLGQAPGYAVEVLSAEGAPVRTASGHVIQPDGAVAEAGTDYGLVVIPPVEGVRLHAGFVPDARLLAWLGACRQQGARVLAMTTGACFVAAGLGGPALLATHWAYARTLQQRYPARRFVARQSCLHADGVWTTGTLSGGFDALLEMLAQDRGDRFSQLCATHLLVSAPERLNPVLPGCRNHCDDPVLKLQDWIESHHAEAVTIERMSREAGMSERTLKRRFRQATRMSPHLYVQMVRIDKAKKLLLSTGLPVKTIAGEVGYENVSFFVRLFKAHTGQTPAVWRGSEVKVPVESGTAGYVQDQAAGTGCCPQPVPG